MVEERYSYPLWLTLLTIVPPSVFFLMGLVWPFLWLGAVLGLLPHGMQTVSEYIGGLLFGSIPCLLGGTLLTYHTEIVVTDRGLKARIFIFKWVFIPWEDVLGVIVPPIAIQYGAMWGADALRFMRAIRVRRLTLFHRLMSLSQRTGWQPVLIVNYRLRGYDELLQTIEDRVSASQAAGMAQLEPE
jgi:hypothetical protein